MKKLNIGVVGHTGMVGSQVYSFFKTKLPTFGVSKHPSGKLIGSWTRLNENCEVIFVCVPTPYNFKTKRPDFGIVEEVLKKIDAYKQYIDLPILSAPHYFLDFEEVREYQNKIFDSFGV